MRRKRTLISMILILLMFFNIPLVTRGNDIKCDHSSYTDYYDETEFAENGFRRHWYNRKCDNCGIIIDRVAGSWKHYHYYDGGKIFVRYEHDFSVPRCRRIYKEICGYDKCGHVKYSYGDWIPME